MFDRLWGPLLFGIATKTKIQFRSIIINAFVACQLYFLCAAPSALRLVRNAPKGYWHDFFDHSLLERALPL
ncbi:hypothetical protein DESC_590046 [Desulfosarcina cetonica]|nr:hypothetical protein DESC_590046 [Desulfosarcina cetonica]